MSLGLFGKRKIMMDQTDLYEMQAGMEDSSERLEKKEQLRAKVQALVSYYEEEKRRNEELTMEVERLKAEQQQMQGMSGPISLGAPAPGMGAPPAANGGVPFSPRPQPAAYPQPQQNAFGPQPFAGASAAPGLDFLPAPLQQPQAPQAPQAPGGYNLQSFGAPPAPQGMPYQQRPPMPPQQNQNPYGAPPAPPAPWQQEYQMPQPPQPFEPQRFAPAPQPYGQPPAPPQPYGQPAFGAAPPQGMYPPQAPVQQSPGVAENIGTVLQTITQVRAKLHQFESIRGYQQQPAYVDYDTVALLDKLYDQLGDLSRELMQRR